MSKSNKCPIDSSSSSEKGFGNYQHRPHAHHASRTDNPLSHICRYLDVSESRKSSKDNVELALEVEINESLKHVLTNPDFNSSDLLDVTIIRPSDSDTTHETTVALNKDEVRDFISLVEQHHRHQKEPNHNEKSKEIRSRNEDNTNETTHKEKSQKHRSHRGNKSESKHRKEFEDLEELQEHEIDDKNDKIGNDAKHVYATMNTFDKLRHSLPCTNKDRDNSKPGTPCMCQHCGVVGVLVQSQKGPIAPFPPLEESSAHQTPRRPIRPRPEATPPRRDIRRRLGELKRKQSIDQLQLLREISARIKSLERRIAIQEETAVPREYLKHILHKILTQYNNFKVPPSQAILKMKNNATQYSMKSAVESAAHKNLNSINLDRKKKEEDSRKCFQIHAVLDDHPKWLDNSKNKGNEGKSSSSTNDNAKVNRDHLYWLWGEEVVKPGCDLKNKILKLLDDKLHKSTCDTSNQSEPIKSSENHTPQPTLFNQPEKPNFSFTNEGIKVEKDEKTIFLNDVPHDTKLPANQFNYLLQGTTQLPTTDSNKDDNSTYSRPVREPPLPTNVNRFSNFRNMTPRSNYPFDLKKTTDDSTFRKNIEAQKEKHKEKPPPAPVEEKYFNAYATHSITTESQASMNFILQKLKNNAKVLESGLPREREQQLETAFKIPDTREKAYSVIKENLNRGGFRLKKEVAPVGEAVDVKFVNPKIRQWSEESSTSEDKLLRQKAKTMSDKKDNVTLERKESLIYKLDFLKNLARNKSTDQSRVLNKIWNQAKNTAKSKKDAVYIKIPFKNVNTCENQNNLIEMHLTLEELETVVKATNKTPSTPPISQHHVHVQSYKSTSEIDFGQRKHEEMKYVNRELLRRRQLSAKTNRNKDRRIFV